MIDTLSLWIGYAVLGFAGLYCLIGIPIAIMLWFTHNPGPRRKKFLAWIDSLDRKKLDED